VAEITTQRREGGSAVAHGERAAQTEKRILDAAEVLFARRGLRGTRVREIAEGAGVNGATLYNYYPSKSALYEAVLERGVRPMIELVRAFASGPQDIEATRRLVHGVMAHLGDRPHVSRLIYLEVIAEGEYLPVLASRWFGPLVAQMMEMLKARPVLNHWEEGLLPILAALFLHLSFGHFALAPLLKAIFHSDPLSPEGIAGQTHFVETLIHQIFPDTDGSHPGGRKGS